MSQRMAMKPRSSDVVAGICRNISRRALNVGLLGLAAGGAIPARAETTVLNDLLRYRVSHSIYGDIGTYANEVARQGDTVIVRTTVRLLVSLLGIALYRENADRTEHWSGDRLVTFHGVTTENGKTTNVFGEARADGFIITSPQGIVVAPANVRPSNPWSAGFLNSDTMMLSDVGSVQHVVIGPPTITVLTINRSSVRTKEYRIVASPAYKVWLNERNVPVMFAVYDDSGLVTFTLLG